MSFMMTTTTIADSMMIFVIGNNRNDQMKLRPSFAEIVVRLRRMSNLLSTVPDRNLSDEYSSDMQLASGATSTNSNMTEIEIRIDDEGLQEDMQEFEQLEREGRAADDEDDQRAQLLDEYDQTM